MNNDSSGPIVPSSGPDPRAILINNERIKLRAGLLNSTATACFGAGGVTPIALLIFGTAPPHHILWLWGAGMLIFLATGLVLHHLALRSLGGLIQ